MREEEGLAAKALASLGLEIGAVRSTIESVLGRNQRIIIQQIIPTSRVKRVIELAFEEARRMGNTYAGSEHLLLGLLVEGEGIAAHVLEDFGANLEKVRAEIDRLHREMPPESAAGESEVGREERRGTLGHTVTSEFSSSFSEARFRGMSPSGRWDIPLAAERLAAEQHRVVGLEHVLLAALEPAQGGAGGGGEALACRRGDRPGVTQSPDSQDEGRPSRNAFSTAVEQKSLDVTPAGRPDA
jgi:hypothetical protein